MRASNSWSARSPPRWGRSPWSPHHAGSSRRRSTTRTPARRSRAIEAKLRRARARSAPRRLATVRREVDDYFEGRIRTFATAPDLALAPRASARRVLEVTTTIPYGELWTYGDVAEMAGSPRGGRAAGTALSRCPDGAVRPVPSRGPRRRARWAATGASPNANDGCSATRAPYERPVGPVVRPVVREDEGDGTHPTNRRARRVARPDGRRLHRRRVRRRPHDRCADLERSLQLRRRDRPRRLLREPSRTRAGGDRLEHPGCGGATGLVRRHLGGLRLPGSRRVRRAPAGAVHHLLLPPGTRRPPPTAKARR